MKKLWGIFICLLLQACFIEYRFAAPSSAVKHGRCELYTGTECPDTSNRKYFIPADKTQSQMDNLITTLLNSVPSYKYQACPEFMKKTLCYFIYNNCENHINKTKVFPPCKNGCHKVQESFCFKGLDKKGDLWKWFDKNLKCDQRHDAEAVPKKCEDVNVEDNRLLAEYSCLYSNQNRTDAKNLFQSAIQFPLRAFEQPSTSVPLMKSLLPLYFPSELPNDIECFTVDKKLSQLTNTKNIHMLPNLSLTGKDIENIQATIYCCSKKTGVKIIPVAVKQERYTPDKYLELNELNYALVDDGSSVSLGAYGALDVCFQGNFKYNMKQKDNDVTIFNAVCEETIPITWFHDYFQMSNSMTQNFNRILLCYSIFGITSTKRFHWTTIWESNKKFHILKDTAPKTYLELHRFGPNYEYKKLEINIDDIQILVGSREKYYAIYMKYETPKEFLMTDLVRSLLHKHYGHTLSDMFDIFHLDDIFKPNSVEYYLKTFGNYDEIKDSMILDKTMEVVKFAQKKEFTIQANLFGVISNDNGYLPSWIQAGGAFELKANYDQSSKVKFELHFIDALNDKNCHTKEQDWQTFHDVINYLDKATDCDGGTKKQLKKIVQCVKCCPRKKLVSIKLYKIEGIMTAATIEIVLQKGAEETTLKYDNLALYRIFDIPTIWNVSSGSGESSQKLCEF